MNDLNLYSYKAKILSVYDGDGVYTADIDLGIGISMRKHLRLYGVDCPELRGIQRNAGIIVRDYVRSVILNQDVVIKTYKDKSGKYGRLLCDVYFHEHCLSEVLIGLSYAQPYFGGTKEPWTTEKLQIILDDG